VFITLDQTWDQFKACWDQNSSGIHIVPKFWKKPGLRAGMIFVGALLLLISPLIGVLPGPGGIVAFAAGLSLVLRYSIKARRNYVRFSKRWPKHGGWVDWVLRRKRRKRAGRGQVH